MLGGMTTSKEAWIEVGNRLSSLGLKLKLHAQEELSGEGVNLRGGVDQLAQAVKETFDGLGDAVKDPAVREDVRATIDRLADALRATLDDLRSGVRLP